MIEDLKRIEKTAEIRTLLDHFLEDAIGKVGLELKSDAELVVNLKADSGYQTKQTYQRINELQWVLIQSILESDIGSKKERPCNKPDTQKYPLFNLFQNEKTTS